MSNHCLDLEKPVDDEDGSDSFVDKLVAQIVKNLKVTRFKQSIQISCTKTSVC